MSPTNYTALPSEADNESHENSQSKTGRLASFWTQLLDLYHRNVGLLLIVASQAFLASVNVAVKKLNTIDPPVPTFELIFIRMAITYMFSIAYMTYTGVESPFFGPKGVRLLLMFRGFTGFFGLFGIYFALRYLSLSDATVLTFLSPLCTSVAGAIFLAETVGRKEIFAGVFQPGRGQYLSQDQRHLISFIEHGVNFTSLSNSTISNSSPPPPSATPTERLIAVGVSLVGVLGSAGAYTSIRAIGTRAHALHSMVSFSGYSVIVSAIGLAVTHTPIVIPTSPIWLLLLLEIGVFGFCAQIFLTLGFQRETASRGTLAIYTLVGTLIIVGSALWVAVTKDNKGGSEGSKGVTAGAGGSSTGADAEGEQGILLKHLEEGIELDGESEDTVQAS
ncbi:hypothetical protein BT96DRAFT_1020384 [Gymnopus androsaceus JB14]|uniref:EamA domain-containing protein n=1 Tax=Gymnopus androsaceus JB14 TaxID=1447944 RepID=A0A6A4HLX9_9AGAR|nr:hypothetical protein BT96DRAFT_1020384 [Gymnopus androsaceus JB14]